jgi:hypothetical protein
LLEIRPPKATGVTIEETGWSIVSARQNFLLQKDVQVHRYSKCKKQAIGPYFYS